MDIIHRFERLYFGDKVLQSILIDASKATVCLEIDSVVVLKETPEASIFDPEQVHEPARLSFLGCREIRFSEGTYAMNGTIVDFSACVRDDGLVEFHFALTGGWDNQTFWREITVVAQEFAIEGAEGNRNIP